MKVLTVWGSMVAKLICLKEGKRIASNFPKEFELLSDNGISVSGGEESLAGLVVSTGNEDALMRILLNG